MTNKIISPIFLGGTGRSGTTILRDILLQSESIVGCSNELRFTVDPNGILDLYDALSTNWDPYRADTAILQFDNFVKKSIHGNIFYALVRHGLGKVKISGFPYRHIRLKNHKHEMMIEHKKFIAQVHSSRSNTIWYGSRPFKINPQLYETNSWEEKDLSQAFTQHFSAFFNAMDPIKNDSSQYWLDDTPYCTSHAQSLKKIFPESKFINIYRDPRNVLASYLHKIWGGDIKDLENIALRIKNVYLKIEQERKEIPENDYINVSFEKLIHSPVQELEIISEKLDLQKSIKTHLIKSSKVTSYSKFFTKSQLNSINTILADEIKKYESTSL